MRAKVAVLILFLGACTALFAAACIDGTTANCDAGSGCEPGEGAAPLPDASEKDGGADTLTTDTSMPQDAPAG
mgnify:CR=1 FL=1